MIRAGRYICIKQALPTTGLLFAIFLLSGWFCAGYSQTVSAVDSLVKELDTMSGTTAKVERLILIARSLENSDPQTAMDYATGANELAKDIKDRPGEAASLRSKAALLRS